jgi:predicted chitinase
MSSAVAPLKGAGHSIASGADGLDPTVQAVKEISGIFSPLSAVFKPTGRLFGRGKTPEQKNQRENVTWYRRIWSAVKNPAAGGGGMGLIMTALMSMLGMLLAPIKALGRLLCMGSLAKLLGGAAGGLGGRGGRNSRSKLGSAAPATADGKKRPGTAVPAGGAKEAGAKAAGGKGMLGKAAGFGKGLLKRIPFIGAALGLGMAASSAMASDDPNLTADENKKERYGSVGSGIGGVVGGVVGMLGGPAGAIAGAMIGDQLGTMVGEWLATVDLASLPGKIGDALTSLKDGALSAFDSVKEVWAGMVATGAKLLAGMTDSVKEAFGKAVDSLLGFKDTVADKVQTAKDYVGDKATSVKDEAQNVVYKASGGRLGAGGSDGRKAELIKAMDAGGITDQKSKAMFMANVDHETGGFTKNEENLDYSAKRLQEVFPKYYSTPEAARADAGNPEAIANKVYGNRMGNTNAGDGFKYRARGDIQLTGKAQYAEMGKKLGIDLVNNPDLAMDPKYSPQIAVQKWKSSGADRAAMAGDQVRARKLTNGGTNGLAEVQGKYDGYLAQAKVGDLTPTRRADQGTVQAPDGANAALATTMSAVKGTPAVGVMPIGPRSSVAQALPGTQTVGVMAPTVPAMGMASVKPISAGTMVAPSYSPPAADASLLKIAPTPAVEKPLMTAGKAAAAPSVQFSVPLTQNMEDRQIAHVASGGIGMD